MSEAEANVVDTRSYTVQAGEEDMHPLVSSVGGVGSGALQWIMRIQGQLDTPPCYGNPSRDQWLADFVLEDGNDILAGAIATVTNKVVATNWYVEGPALLALRTRDMLLYESEFMTGWDAFSSKWIQSYYIRDGGGNAEPLRKLAGDHDGPALGVAHMDESRCELTGDPEWPIIYNNQGKGPIKVHRSQVARIVDSPNPEKRYGGRGRSGTSRSTTTAQVLMDVVRYKRERLSDLPAAGLLILNNLGELQWEDLTKKYDTRQQNQGNLIWRDIMVACGVDPAYPTTAKMVPFSELPQHYNEKEAMEIAVYSFALSFREAPQEFWPVSAGPLGTGTEAQLQAHMAKSKGTGAAFAAIERQLNRPDILPAGILFKFDQRDDDEDLLRAQINDTKTQWIRRLWEASPNRSSAVPGTPGAVGVSTEADGEGPDRARFGYTQAERAIGVDLAEGEGMLSAEQVQQLLVWEKVIPPEILGMAVDVDRLYDVRGVELRETIFGPKIRLWKDGRALTLNPPQQGAGMF